MTTQEAIPTRFSTANEKPLLATPITDPSLVSIPCQDENETGGDQARRLTVQLLTETVNPTPFTKTATLIHPKVVTDDVAIGGNTAGAPWVFEAATNTLNNAGDRFLHRTGTGNTFVGRLAGNTSLTSTNSVGIGLSALSSLTSGNGNVAVGPNAGKAATTASSNLFFGVNAGANLVTGSSNVAIGQTAMGITAGGSSNCVAVGSGALQNVTGNANIAIGVNSQDEVVAGASNVSIGLNSLGQLVSGSQNTAIGHHAGLVATADNGTAIGAFALSACSSGANNIAIGGFCGDNITTGSNNLMLGYNIDAQSATASNQMSIGNLLFSQGIDGTATTISSGNLGVGTATPGARLAVTASGAANVVHRINMASGQTANALEVLDSVGTNIFSLAPPSGTTVDLHFGVNINAKIRSTNGVLSFHDNSGTTMMTLGSNGPDINGKKIMFASIAGFERTALSGHTGTVMGSSDTAVSFRTGNVLVGRFDNDATAGNTRLLVYDVDTATLARVSVGAADSGGSGFKLLRIPN